VTLRARGGRLGLYAAMAATAASVFGYALYWRAGAARLAARVEAFVEARRADGAVVDHRGVDTFGFPFLWRARIASPSVETAGGARWSADALLVDALPYALDRVVLSPQGGQTVSAPGWGAFAVRADRFRGGLSAGGPAGAPWRAAIEADGLFIETADGRVVFAADEVLLDAFPLSLGLRVGGRGSGLKAGGVAADYLDFDAAASAGADAVELLIDRVRITAGGGAVSADGEARIGPRGASARLSADFHRPDALAGALEAAGLDVAEGAFGPSPADVRIQDGDLFIAGRRAAGGLGGAGPHERGSDPLGP